MLLRRIDLWLHVTVTPDITKTIVFNKGTVSGSIQTVLSKPMGGQEEPSSILGDKLDWKYAQNQLKKNITSEATKKINPIRKPLRTFELWYPKYEDSRTTSRHQANITHSNNIKPHVLIKPPNE
jgi:hypothetical protein